LAACKDEQIIEYLKKIKSTLQDADAVVPSINPWNLLITEIKRLLLKEDVNPAVPRLIVDLCAWIVLRWFDGTKIWRIIYIPRMIECNVLGLQAQQLKVVEQWLEVAANIVKVRRTSLFSL